MAMREMLRHVGVLKRCVVRIIRSPIVPIFAMVVVLLFTMNCLVVARFEASHLRSQDLKLSVAWPRKPPPAWPSAPMRIFRFTAFSLTADQAIYNKRRPAAFGRRHLNDAFIMEELRSGWPLPIYRSIHLHQGIGIDILRQTTLDVVDLPVVRRGLRVAKLAPHSVLLSERTIPVHPIWANWIVVHAAATLLVFMLYKVILCTMGCLRRMLRARSGQCTQCGFPATGLDLCPECGATLAR